MKHSQQLIKIARYIIAKNQAKKLLQYLIQDLYKDEVPTQLQITELKNKILHIQKQSYDFKWFVHRFIFEKRHYQDIQQLLALMKSYKNLGKEIKNSLKPYGRFYFSDQNGFEELEQFMIHQYPNVFEKHNSEKINKMKKDISERINDLLQSWDGQSQLWKYSQLWQILQRNDVRKQNKKTIIQYFIDKKDVYNLLIDLIRTNKIEDINQFEQAIKKYVERVGERDAIYDLMEVLKRSRIKGQYLKCVVQFFIENKNFEELHELILLNKIKDQNLLKKVIKLFCDNKCFEYLYQLLQQQQIKDRPTIKKVVNDLANSSESQKLYDLIKSDKLNDLDIKGYIAWYMHRAGMISREECRQFFKKNISREELRQFFKIH